jgi:hypothetical protein
MVLKLLGQNEDGVWSDFEATHKLLVAKSFADYDEATAKVGSKQLRDRFREKLEDALTVIRQSHSV